VVKRASQQKGTTVIDPKILDNLASRLAAALPPGIHEIKQDAEKNFRAVLESTFARLNLVTREEFDVQTAVLSRAHAKVQELEEQIMRLETRLQRKGAGGDASQTSHGF
jgi:BMFP domain-containing protein YqiC